MGSRRTRLAWTRPGPRDSLRARSSCRGLTAGPKRSLDRSYLGIPEATGHVEVLPLHQAVAIERDAGRYALTTVRLRDDGRADGEPRRLYCKQFLAAGSIGTTSLLVHARPTGALPLNEHGCRLTRSAGCARQACDLVGRVKGQPHLYVVDGALIEGSTGLSNPSFTIAALAERCLDRVAPRLAAEGGEPTEPRVEPTDADPEASCPPANSLTPPIGAPAPSRQTSSPGA